MVDTRSAYDLDILAEAPTSAMSERDLTRGYSGKGPVLVDVVRRTEVARNQVEPCACGGTIVVVWPSLPAEAIVEHNQVPAHVVWRRRMGIA